MMMDTDSFTDRTQTPLMILKPAMWLGLLLAVTLFGIPWLPWQQTASGNGRVVAYAPVDREQVIEAPIRGRIVEWYVVEGDHVAPGDPIVALEDIDAQFVERMEGNRSAIQDRISAAQDESNAYKAQEDALERARRVTLAAAALKVNMATQKILAAEQTLQAQEANLKTVELNLKRQRSLFEEGLASKRDLELAELALADAETRRNKAQAAVMESEAHKLSLVAERMQKGAEANAKISETHAKWQKAAATRSKATEELNKIETTLSRQSSRLVRAPREGNILNIMGSEGGKVVKVGEQLGLLVPSTGDRAVEIWVDGNDAPLITKGREVRLQFEGWPAIQFAGWPSVAVGTFGGRVALVDALSRNGRGFRVLVIPDADQEAWPEMKYLRQGVKAKAWVLLDQVSLGYEAWRQINGFPAALPDRPIESAPKVAKERLK